MTLATITSNEQKELLINGMKDNMNDRKFSFEKMDYNMAYNAYQIDNIIFMQTTKISGLVVVTPNLLPSWCGILMEDH